MAELYPNIPLPFSFSPLKHLFKYQTGYISSGRSDKIAAIKNDLLSIGENLMDVYCGPMSIHPICNEIIEYLTLHGISNRNKYLNFLGDEEYIIVRCSDSTRWVIRLSENPERYVHIHPAKKSPNTFRIKGTTLKTVMASLILIHDSDGSKSPDLAFVNKIRKEMLNLSPVKSLEGSNRLSEWLAFYNVNHVETAGVDEW